MPSCSIIIPSWNGRPLLEHCLPFALEVIDPNRDEVIVVDDGSTDDTCDWMAVSFPDVRIVRMDTNQGYGAACNAGVAQSDRDVVLLLNNDVAVIPPFLPPLLAHFRDDEVFAVNAQVFQADGVTPGGGLVRGVFHFGLLRLRWSEDAGEREHTWRTLYANGAATAVCRRKYLALGGYDSLYAPFYSEDLDLSYRAYQRGWHVLYEPRSTARHDHSVTITRVFAADYIERISKRNRILFVWRNIRDPALLMYHIIGLKIRALGAVLTFDTIFLRALGDALRMWPGVRARRRRDPAPVVSDRAILKQTSEWMAP